MATGQMFSSHHFGRLAVVFALMGWQGLVLTEAKAELVARYSFDEVDGSDTLTAATR